MGERTAQVSVGGIDPGDLIPNEQARAEALREFLSGSPFGAPTREEQVGITSQPPDRMLEQPIPLSFEEQVQAAEQWSPQGSQPQDSQPPIQDWQRLYGQSENEKGEWRRKAAELEETLNLVLNQQQPQPQPTMPANYSMPYQGQQPVYGNQPQVDPFEGMGDDDVVQGKQVKQLIGQHVAPYMWQLHQQTQAAHQEVAQLRQQQFTAAKRSAGIDNLTELRFKAKYPQVAGMPDSVEKLNLMQALMKVEQPTQAAPVPPITTQSTNPTQNIVRRVTYTESNRGVAGEPNTDRNSLFQAKMAEAAKQPFHLRANAMKAVFKEFEVPQINTFGTGRFRV